MRASTTENLQNHLTAAIIIILFHSFFIVYIIRTFSQITPEVNIRNDCNRKIIASESWSFPSGHRLESRKDVANRTKRSANFLQVFKNVCLQIENYIDLLLQRRRQLLVIFWRKRILRRNLTTSMWRSFYFEINVNNLTGRTSAVWIVYSRRVTPVTDGRSRCFVLFIMIIFLLFS